MYPNQNGARRLFSIDLCDEVYDPSILFEPSDMSENLSLQEQLRRERMRYFGLGISSYKWFSHDHKDGILVPLNGKVFYYFVEDKKVVSTELAYDSSKGDAIDPSISPDGKTLAFVLNENIYIKKKGEVPTQITTNGNKNGSQFFVI